MVKAREQDKPMFNLVQVTTREAMTQGSNEELSLAETERTYVFKKGGWEFHGDVIGPNDCFRKRKGPMTHAQR